MFNGLDKSLKSTAEDSEQFTGEKKENSQDSWTTERFKEEFFLDLIRVRINGVRKYYEQAKEKIYWIPVSQPPIPFIINFSDLSSIVQRQFLNYCKENNERNVTILLKEIAGRFFENLDEVYYHRSIMRKLQVRLEEE